MGTDNRWELLRTADLEAHFFVVFAKAYLIMQIISFPSAHKGDTNISGCVLRIWTLVCHIKEATDLGCFGSVLQKIGKLKKKEVETYQVLHTVARYDLHRLLILIRQWN
jgi:hypothetical protein